MLIKEYRIPLPLTIDEYRIAQLYMIAKKSRDESSGEGSGVEIILNEPYENGPGGNGQYTKKIYHVGSHLPGWIISILPKSALIVEEEAWNAYPFTKTRYTCPFVEKFSLDIETYYYPDNGYQENVFRLTGTDLKTRIVDVIDIVKDQLYGGDYVQEEDPVLYKSIKTGRGPLGENWLDEYWNMVEGKSQPTSDSKSLMCAYKLCRVEFRYWGMQTKLEKFIHDVALRKTMLRAHRQAWAWQDEWNGLTMDDIREFEKKTQTLLAKKMGKVVDVDSEEDDEKEYEDEEDNENYDNEIRENLFSFDSISEKSDQSCSGDENDLHKDIERIRKFNQNVEQIPTELKIESFDIQAKNWITGPLEIESKSGSDDEFFDCIDEPDKTEMEILQDSDEGRIRSMRVTKNDSQKNMVGFSEVCSIKESNQESLKSSILVLVCHAGSILDSMNDISTKISDYTTFKTLFETIMRQYYRSLSGNLILKLVPCTSICKEAIRILSSLSPYSFAAGRHSTELSNNIDLPLGAIPLLTEVSLEYEKGVDQLIDSANQVYRDFLNSADGRGFNSKVILISDSIGSILTYEALCRVSKIEKKELNSQKTEYKMNVLDFEVSDFFMFGSSLAIILAFRRLRANNVDIIKPSCQQVYNMFHPTDPASSRIEPLLNTLFSSLPPVNVPQYIKYPLGNGQTLELYETIHSTARFVDNIYFGCEKRFSKINKQSTTMDENYAVETLNQLKNIWWGIKRLDYALYCPEGLASLPSQALPHLFHASYWESADVVAFILRQITGMEKEFQNFYVETTLGSHFSQGHKCEKWIRKRTSVKIKNVAPNHRANDVIVLEGKEQKLSAKFMYGPLDMFTLTGEKVDIFLMESPPGGEWTLLTTEITDKTGRIVYNIPSEKSLGYGIYQIKMIVKGDHTCVDLYIAVVPLKTECVVFSIDGSFTASMSVTGRDPKVRAGAVDICRHWQELGYLLIYITGRPDLQQKRVVSWLCQHNFPHGFISFAEGLSTDPLGHKTAYLKNLILSQGISITAAYGSNKDISVYTSIGLQSNQIYIIGKVSKKLQTSATVLSEGYANHLKNLKIPGGSRPAMGNARMVIPQVHFRKYEMSWNRICAKNVTENQLAQ